MVVAAVIALLSTLFAATAAHAGTGSITGKVTKPSGSALSGSTVDLYSIADDDYIWFEKSVETRSDGTYTFGSLDRGQYIVGFGYESRTYADEYWSNEELIQDADAISVGSSRVSSINARLAVGGKISGRVTTDSPNSHPVADAEAIAYRWDASESEWIPGKSAFTSVDGSYTIGGLSDADWTVEFNPPYEGPDADLALEYWEDERSFDSAHRFLVRMGQTDAGIDASLSPGGRISGRVTGPNGEPVVDALVFGYPGHIQEMASNVAFTDENGNYTMTGLSPGPHRLEFVDSLEFDNPFGDEGYASEWWDDESSFHGADNVDVVAGTTTTGKNAQLDLAGTPLVNMTPPSITGTPRVGATLTAEPGVWTPHVSDETFSYQWFDEGTAILGADRKTFEPRASHLGRSISVEVTASRSGNTTSAMSVPTTPVTKGELIAYQPAELSPVAPRVGAKLEIDPAYYGNLSYSNTFEYLADGVPFTYSSEEGVPAGVVGKKLSVRQVTTADGYETATTTSNETQPVQNGTFNPATTARIQGVPIVGEPLTTERINDVAGADYRYQWLAGGAEISGADQPTYTPTSAEVGKSLSVRLSMSKAGYSPAESTGGSTDPVVEAGFLHVTPGTPTVTGTPRIYQTLTASPGTWAPSGVQFTYEWLADGETIPGATDPTLTLTAAQGGKKIAVKVTGSKSGYSDESATSAETASVLTSTPFGAPKDLAATSSTATSLGLTWTDVDNAAGYRIYYGIGSGTRTKVEVGDVTSKTLRGLKPNTAYTIDIAALRSNGTRSSYSPRITARTAPLTAPIDLEVTRESPTSVTLAWTKVPGISKYRISHRIGTGTRTTADVGDVSTKTITGLKPGTTYSISIASLLSDGTRSSYSPLVDAPTAPFLPPTNLASPGATSSTIDLTWTKAPGATRYRISYGIGDGTRTGFTIADASSRTLTGLMPGTTYNVMIAGIMSDGTRSPYSPPLDVTTD
jgi:hypothetical protein